MNILHVNNRRGALCYSQGGRMGYPACRTYCISSHYNCVIMSPMAFQITSLAIVCSIVSGKKHQSSVPLPFVRGIYRRPGNSPPKGTVTRKMFPFYDVIMERRHLKISLDWNYQEHYININLFMETHVAGQRLPNPEAICEIEISDWRYML